MASSPRPLTLRLRRAGASVRVQPQGMDGWVRWRGSRLEELEGGVALERLGERHAALGAELVEFEPAHTATEGEKGQVH